MIIPTTSLPSAGGMPEGGILGLMGGLPLIGPLIQSGLNYDIQRKNLAAQEADREYMKWAQGITWSREDNSVQRRVADLRAAGLSPTLAAGSGAQSSAPVKLTVPQQDLVDFTSGGNQILSALQSMLNMKSMRENIVQTKAQTDYIIENTKKLEIDNLYKEEFNPIRITLAELKRDFDEGTLENRIKMIASKLTTEEVRQDNIRWDTKLEIAGIGRAFVQSALDWVRGRLYNAWADEANRRNKKVDEYKSRADQEKELLQAEIEVKKALAAKYKAEESAASEYDKYLEYQQRDKDTLDWKDFIDLITP